MQKKSFNKADYLILSVLFFIFSWNLAGLAWPLKWIVEGASGTELVFSIVLFVISAILLPFTGYAFYKTALRWVKIYVWK